MPRKDSIEIHGKRVARLREDKGWSQGKLANMIGFSGGGSLSRIERQERVSVARQTIADLAAAFEKPFEEMRKELVVLTTNYDALLDANVEPYSEVNVGEIPLFELSVAAGGWADITEMAEVCRPDQIDSGVFRIRIRGDSMKPKFVEGDVVEFRCLRDGRDELATGKAYYVQRDGQGTFKMLESFDDERYTFRALNKRKYPDPIVVERREASRMAVAKAKVQILE